MTPRILIIIGLTLALLVDLVIPLPILGVGLLLVAITRPNWFLKMVYYLRKRVRGPDLTGGPPTRKQALSG